MPMQEDLSLRHLPEVSEDSWSFQIPTSSIPKGDDLLVDNSNFFEGADASILATPAPATQQTNHTHSRVVSQFTSRPSIWESSPAHQPQQRGHVASPPSPSTSYGHAQAQRFPITQGPISSKELGRHSAEDPHEEARCRNNERQEQPLQPSTSTTSSTSLNDIASPPSTFAERSPLESHLEVGHSEPGLRAAESQPQVSTAATDVTEKERQSVGKLQGKLKSPGGKRLSRGAPTEGQRSTALTKALRRPIVAGGTVKCRNRQKTAATLSARSKTESIAPMVAPLTVKTPSETEATGDGLISDETHGPDLSLSSFVSDRGVAGRLIAYSQRLMSKKNTMRSTVLNAEPNYQSENDKAHPTVLPAQDIKLNMGDQQVDLSRGSGIIDSGVGHRNDDQDNPLTLSQLSPRKRRAVRSTAGPELEGMASFAPTLPVLEPTGLSCPTSKKRPAPSMSANCHDQRQIRKKGKDMNAISAAEGSGLAQAVPTPTPAFAPGDSLLHSASASLSAVSEVGFCNSGTAVNGSDMAIEDDGDKEGVNVGKSGPAKSTSASAMISETVPMGSKVGKQSGSTANPKRVGSGPTGMGARTRLRRASKACSSINGGRTLRPRSVSASASVHAGVLRASERGRRIAQARTRREARDRGRERSIATDADADGDTGNSGSSVNSDLKRSGLTYMANSTRPVEFKFASDLRIQARKGDEETMTRSASTVSSGSGEGGYTDRRLRPIPGFKVRRGAQASEEAHWKENIQPVITRPFHLITEERIKERRRFDEAVKEKERAKETEEEERRREREEEEEREVRELRKRAIPKANAVPEWYKGAPKKKKDEERIDSGRR